MGIKENLNELTELTILLEPQVKCNHYSPNIHKHSGHMYTLCCDNPNKCKHSNIRYMACVPYGDDEREKVYVDICEACYEALRGNKDDITSKIANKRLKEFLKTSNVDDWR